MPDSGGSPVIHPQKQQQDFQEIYLRYLATGSLLLLLITVVQPTLIKLFAGLEAKRISGKFIVICRAKPVDMFLRLSLLLM